MDEVRLSASLAERVTSRWGPDRSASGGGSEYDFWSGPIQAALVGFRDFDALPVVDDPRVRLLYIPDPVFGPVVFVGVRIADGIVEIADFADDPDYWEMLGDDPDD